LTTNFILSLLLITLKGLKALIILIDLIVLFVESGFAMLIIDVTRTIKSKRFHKFYKYAWSLFW